MNTTQTRIWEVIMRHGNRWVSVGTLTDTRAQIDQASRVGLRDLLVNWLMDQGIQNIHRKHKWALREPKA